MFRLDERLVAEQIQRGGTLAERQAQAAGQALSSRRRVPALSSANRAELPRVFGPEEYILGSLLLRPELLAQLDEEMIAQQAPPLSPDDLTSAEKQALHGRAGTVAEEAVELSAKERLAQLAEPLQAGAQAA